MSNGVFDNVARRWLSPFAYDRWVDFVDEVRAMLPPTEVSLMLIKDEPFKMINLEQIPLTLNNESKLIRNP